MILIALPFALAITAWYQWQQSALITSIVALASLGLLMVDFERTRPGLRQIMPCVVMGSLAAAGRVLLFAIPDVKPVSALCILAGAVFGPRCGFITGAIAALVSNFFLGQGAWTPWQMYSWGLVGYGAGLLAQKSLLDKRAVLFGYGFGSALLFGFIMNSWHIVGFVHPITLPAVIAAFGAGLPFDIVHGIATVVFLRILYEPLSRKLKRIRDMY